MPNGRCATVNEVIVMPDSHFVSSALVVFLLSYLVGCTPCGFLIGKFNGLDIRRHGSCNIGATNVRRTLGRDWGLLCFFLDFFKGYLPVLVIGHGLGAATAVGFEWGGIFAAFGTVLGHVYPCWLNFKGGKGVATTLGALVAVSWLAVLIALVTWVICFLVTRYVSVASLGAAVMLPVGYIISGLVRDHRVVTPSLVLLTILAAVIIHRHRSNIERLRAGNEYRFGTVR